MLTGAFGKWGLGFVGTSGDPNQQGIDQFFGYNCQRLAHNYYPDHLWNNLDKVILDGNKDRGTADYAPMIIHQQALNFIRQNKEKPFFLFYPSVIPHAELVAPEKYLAKFRGKFLPETHMKASMKVVNTGWDPMDHKKNVTLLLPPWFLFWTIRWVKSWIWSSSLGLEDNTIIMFTSDNGPHLEGGADPDYFDSNGPFTGYKRDLYEGGIRVPMLANGKITLRQAARPGILPLFGISCQPLLNC